MSGDDGNRPENAFPEGSEGGENDATSYEELDAMFASSNRRSGFSGFKGMVDMKTFDAFEVYFNTIGAQFFTAEEFLFTGGDNNTAGHKCYGLNGMPPTELWENVRPLVVAMDEIRRRLGVPVRLTNIYRNEPYNKCVGGVKNSQHALFKAADFRAKSGTAVDWWEAAKSVREDNIFSGGIGLYIGKNFVHVDVRGYEANWSI